MAKQKQPDTSIEPLQEFADVGAEALRLELAAKSAELERLQAEMAARDAAAQGLPNSGPGTYRVTVRHAPSKLKRLVVEATGEQDAWAKFQAAAIKAAYNPKLAEKGRPQTGVHILERFFRNGLLSGFDRTIEKALCVVDGQPMFAADLRLVRDKARTEMGKSAWKKAVAEEYGEEAAVIAHSELVEV